MTALLRQVGYPLPGRVPRAENCPLFTHAQSSTCSVLFGSIPTGTQKGGREVILHRLRNPLGIQRKVAKALAMGDEVRADDGHCLGIDALPFCRELGARSSSGARRYERSPDCQREDCP